MSGRRRDAAYWRRRIERDFPELAARLRSGEIASVRAAAIEAGLIHAPSPLMELRRAWRKASPAERAVFMGEIEVGQLVQQSPGARRTRRRSLVQAEDAMDDLFALTLSAAAQGRRVVAEAPRPSEPPTSPATATTERIAGGVAVPRSALRIAARQGVESRQPSTVARVAPVSPPSPPGLAPAPTPAMEPGTQGESLGSGPAAGPASRAAAAEPVPSPLRIRLGMRRLLGLGSDKEAAAARGPASPAEHEAAQHGVAVGQQYVKLDAGPAAWEVLSIFAGPHEVLHVRIGNLEEPDTIRVVSIAALTDRGRYRPLA